MSVGLSASNTYCSQWFWFEQIAKCADTYGGKPGSVCRHLTTT